MASTEFVALLRAINVGAGRKVPMADLRALMADAGATGVATYIQSGNVVFEHATTGEAALRADLEARLEATFGFAIPVILRRADAWPAIVAGNPFPDADPATLHVLFLRDDPPAGASEALEPGAFAPEAFVLAGREAYLRLPDGMGRATLPAVLSRALRTPGTARNWRTLLKLGEMAAEEPAT